MNKKENYTPPKGLVEFLESGPPSIYIGFGSMEGILGNNIIELVKEANEQSACRAIFVSGWGNLKPDLKWEISRGGELFPHLYRELSLKDIEARYDLPKIDGLHKFPDIIS
mgnify:CR=1 FL=1